MQRLRLTPGRWDLDDVVKEGRTGGMGRSLERVRSEADRMESIRERLAGFEMKDVDSSMRAYKGITAGLSRTTARAFMDYSTDTEDQKVKSALDKAEELRAEVENRIIFFRLWWTSLDDRGAQRLTPDNPDFRYFLGLWRKLKPHILEEGVEQAVNLKNVTGFSAWTHHYDKIVSNFTFTLRVKGKVMKDDKGKPRKMIVDEVTRLFSSPDAATREAAYKVILSKYSENGDLLGEVYRTIVRDWKNEFVKLRGYSTAIGPRNLENDVSDEAVKTLLEVCRREGVVFQEFFRAKSKMLGSKKLTRYHIYAPLATKETKHTYSEAVKMVIDAFREFDPQVARLAMRVFEANHVDSTPRKGKTNGAYCYSVTPEIVPYVFLNFSGADRDVYTIAHESGHAIHSQLSSSHSVLTFQPPLVLAETASVFGEMILFEKYMREERDAERRKAVLLDKISSMYATIERQAYFVVFEDQAHKAVGDGATISELCSLYGRVLAEQFGNAVIVPEDFNWEWTYIPHIYHTPFYCYAYAFGNLLSLALMTST